MNDLVVFIGGRFVMAFSKGDIVKLKSGSPNMTVTRVIGMPEGNPVQLLDDVHKKNQGFKDGDVVCQWFEKNKLQSATFHQESIQPAQ